MAAGKMVSVALAVGLGISAVTLLEAGPGDVPVTSILNDADASVAPSLQIQSDGFGPYQHSRTLTSIIQSVGSWALDSYYVRGGTRSFMLRFDQPIPYSGPSGNDPVAPPSGTRLAYFIAKCNTYSYGSMLTMLPGTTIPCPLHVLFDWNGGNYALQMNPNNVNAQESNYANITCTVPATGNEACRQWKIVPSGTFTAPDGTTAYRNVAVLQQNVTVKGKNTQVRQGAFYFSFSIVVSKP